MLYDKGNTFKTSLTKAIVSQSKIIQIATWNDWGEGTVIEPSCEFGYRDLEVLQELRGKHLGPCFPATSSDLRLPEKLLSLRRCAFEKAEQLDEIVELIVNGKQRQARSNLNAIERKRERGNKRACLECSAANTDDSCVALADDRPRLRLNILR